VGIKTDRPYATVDWFGTPCSGALHVIERYRPLDYDAAKQAEEKDENFGAFGVTKQGFAHDPEYKGKGLQLELAVEDEGVFTTPWAATMNLPTPVEPAGTVAGSRMCRKRWI
jgi:hypothetical protein